MKKITCILVFCLLCTHGYSWGFYAHKMINRLAIFSLPPEMFGYFKANIEYLTTHAVDADKRRYADSLEAPRHYIDLDHYEKALPIDSVPCFWKEAAARYTEDTLKAYGTVPWYIQTEYYRLVEAMKNKNSELILKYAADIGHYFADAHVPLHATENYNGQLSNQVGIHGFWESRLPELFSADYDFFVGKATYMDNPLKQAWLASETSFAGVDSVLGFEAKLNAEFAPDKKYSYEQRGQKQVRVYSVEYAAAYHNMLKGQVERRMRSSIAAVASVWYTAWVDAGQPDLGSLINGTPEHLDENQQRIAVQEEQKRLANERMIGRQE